MTENEQPPGFGRKFWKNLVGRLFSVAISLYAAGICLYLLLRIFTGYRLWPVAMVSNFLHWFLLPALILFPIMLWWRRWPTAGMLTAGVIAFIWLFGELFLPQSTISTAHADSDHTLRVMTWNVNSDFATPEEVFTGVRDSGADIIALQEIGQGLAAALDDNPLDEYPYREYVGYGADGIGLLSRHPIIEHEIVEGKTAKPYLIATLSIDGRELTVLSVHPPPPKWGRWDGYYSRGIDEIPHFVNLATSGEPTIMMGDFNTVDQSPDYDLLADSGLHDAFREAGWGFGSTWPNRKVVRLVDKPVIRIDYIWYTDHFTAQRAWVGSGTNSDHLPVLVELTWK